ncbi:MAG: hypothetical protein KC560_07430, partial [Myxococcales bacterium]|nr:hypothetical protein [Myxococcales bacterium]
MASPASTDDALRSRLERRHLRAGWTLVLVFGVAGLALEALHGFKAGFYLDVSNETRRLMWSLAHAHGTLIGLLNLAFAAGLGRLALPVAQLRAASACFVAAGVAMPAGFALGGVVVYGGDPGPAVALAPLGALLLLVAVALAA